MGTLTTGALTLTGQAAAFDVNRSTIYDELIANGGVSLSGVAPSLGVNPDAASSPGQALDLIHANSGTLSGTFAGLNNGGHFSAGGFGFTALYTATDFGLVAVLEPATWLGGGEAGAGHVRPAATLPRGRAVMQAAAEFGEGEQRRGSRPRPGRRDAPPRAAAGQRPGLRHLMKRGRSIRC